MKKFLLAFYLLLFIASTGFAQQFSQYNTGTLYDSFENPSQNSFVPDTSKHYAFNFLIPNINGSFYLKGDAQASVVNRIYGSKFNYTGLQIGQGKYNYANANASAYELMFKIFGSLKGNSEVGLFLETKAEGRGAFTDESFAIFNGSTAFPNDNYFDILNDHYQYQVYDALGLSYREEVTKRLAFGAKLGFLLGTDYSKVDINQSQVNFDRADDAATISLSGKYYQSKGPGKLDFRSFLPVTRSPGVQISLGTTYKTEEGITFQANLKDLGFIHWYNASSVFNFNGTQTATNISGPKREDSVYNAINSILKSGTERVTSFTEPTDARFELSANKSYWLNDDKTFKYSPTLIVSKELWYNGVTGALVNRFQYQHYNVSLTATYDNESLFNLGTQLMYKTYNGEFFIGSDRLFQTVSFAMAKSNFATYTGGAFTGASFFMGFSIKFGPVIEHPMNASVIPTGEKGFLGRLYNRLFKTNW